MTTNLLGVKIDYVTIDQAVGTVEEWLQKKGKHYVVTPNPEMIVDAKFDSEFNKALNEANLAIPDSSRLGWASKLLESKRGNAYPTTAGTDLMEELIKLSEENGYRTAYLGGSKEVAVKLRRCLRNKYPKLKIVFCSGNVEVNDQGNSKFDNAHALSQKIDIMFVAFGHIKQEKWIYKNLPRLNARVMVGVGGAFDYLSGSVPRAPQIFRSLGLEWIFRFLIQPWRIKRFWKLPYFLYMVMSSK